MTVPRREAYLVDEQGERVALEDHFVIGRAREADVVLHLGAVARRHALFTRLLDGGFEVADLSSSNGTFVNGARVTHHRLAPGDVVQVDRRQWRFEWGPAVPPPARDPAADLLARAGDDEAAFAVAVDALLEQGDPLGPRLAAGVPWELPPAVAEAELRGDLLLERRAGAPLSARLRPLGLVEERALLFALLSTEAGRLLRTLALPYWNPRWGLEGAHAPSLRQLRVGPVFSRPAAQACADALAPLSFAGMPHLEAPLVEAWDRAWLDFGAGQVRPLTPGRQESFSAFSVRWEEGAWIARLQVMTQRLSVNRVSRASCVLVPGDELRSGNVACTFRAA